MLEPARNSTDACHADAVSEQVPLVTAEVHVFPALPKAVAVTVVDDTRTVTPLASIDVQRPSRNCTLGPYGRDAPGMQADGQRRPSVQAFNAVRSRIGTTHP